MLESNVRPQWLNFTRRMQQAGCSQKGYAMLTIEVLVDPAGNPVVWWEPKLRRIEPGVSSQVFMDRLTEKVRAEKDAG